MDRIETSIAELKKVIQQLESDKTRDIEPTDKVHLPLLRINGLFVFSQHGDRFENEDYDEPIF
jgi:hypothetical protein